MGADGTRISHEVATKRNRWEFCAYTDQGLGTSENLVPYGVPVKWHLESVNH